ncbi:MAG: type II secretion system protein [Erysipelotrichaceae bacterium]|nr:type II secretion system protein [Erysipelotrichaceae bacterium]
MSYKKGFTLAELLIVVAIIAVLTGVSLPVFNGLPEKGREATDAANIRSQYAKVMAEAITNGGNASGVNEKIDLKQTKDKWQNTEIANTLEELISVKSDIKEPQAGGTAYVECKDGVAYLYYGAGANLNNSKYDVSSLLVKNLSKGDINTSIASQIVSNNFDKLNETLRANGFVGQAVITNDVFNGKYANNIVAANTGYEPYAASTKVVSVPKDGKLMSERKNGDVVSVKQYLYYEKGSEMILYGTRDVNVTVTGQNSVSYDQSDTDGSSWTKA